MKQKKVWSLLILVTAAAIFVVCGCPIRRLVGLPCPGCGLTRACLAALRLDWQSAFFWHPLWLPAIVLLLTGIFRPQGPFRSRRTNNLFLILMGLLFLGVYLWRMVQFFPGTPPMDFNENCIFIKCCQWISGGHL